MTTSIHNAGPEVAVIGAGAVGCAVAWALTRAGRRVLLLDRAEPATDGASFGNAGHIATEQLQPLPSPRLLLSFWRELSAFGGVVDIPARRLLTMMPWLWRFARAALKQKTNTRYLAPLVRCAADRLQARLVEIGRCDLLRRNGHYALWTGADAHRRSHVEGQHAAALGIRTSLPSTELLAALANAAPAPTLPIAGIWFPDSAHVVDPAEVARAFASAALQAGARWMRAQVTQVGPRGGGIEINTDAGIVHVPAAVLCLGAWSAPFLASFGLAAPLEAERGYHVELADQPALADAPLVYQNHNLIVTPLHRRLRASSFLEFAGLETASDPAKPARLRASLRQLGYPCEREGQFWMGPRPTLPDYLPAIGRAAGPHQLYYATGHQHLGLTLAAVTSDLIEDLVCGRPPRCDMSAFDLRRFGPLRSS